MTTTFPKSSPCHRRIKPSSFVLKALPAALTLVFSQAGWAVDPSINVGGAAGLPLNGTVASGAASGSVAGNQLTIDQTSGRAVIDWTSFNIDAGKSVLFNQPTASSAVLNRVNGDVNASQIMGNLSANGTVMLMNPNGIMFGANSVVNVGSLVATTGTINQSEFENHGHAHITGAAGNITNLGHITATAGASGLVALVAPSVINQKSITATGGRIALAGSTAATISLNGGLYEFAIPGGATGVQVSNTAAASLNAANIHIGVGDAANLLSGVINLEGVQQATNAIVVNGHTVELKSALQAPSVSGNSATVNVSSGARIQDGVNIAAAGGTVNVGAGTFNESVNIAKALTLDGAGMEETILRAPTASGNALTVEASDVTLSDLSINDSFYGVHVKGVSNNLTIDRVALNNNKYGVRNGSDVKADNFRMLNSTISGGLIGVQTYNGYEASTQGGKASFRNALFDNVTVDGTTFKGFYFETADNLTMKNVTITNAGNTGDPDTLKYGAAIDVNLKHDDFSTLTFDNVVVANSGRSSGSETSAAVVIKTRGVPGDTAYAAAPASLQAVTIIGGSIEGSSDDGVRGTGIRFETLSNGSGGQPSVTISGGTQFKNNGKDIVVDKTNVDARGAVFVGAANGFAVEDRVTHALDSATRGLVTWTAGNVYVTQNSGSIQRGVNAASAGHTVNVGAGTFAEQVVLDKAGMTLAGSDGAKIAVPDLAEVNGVRIQANNVTVSGMEIAGPVDQPYLSYAWDNNISRGIAVGNGVTGFNISNNNIHDVRNGILIDGRNTGSVTGNRVENTKSAISVQYTDGTGITISGNTQGPVGNEWGTNLHLNGHLDGSNNIVSNTTPISAAPALTWQRSLLDLSTANNGWSVQDQAYTFSNRTHVAVAASGSASNQGSQLTPLNTVQAGVNAVVTGGTVNVAAGTYVQPATLLVNKSLTLAGASQGDTTIDARGVSGYGIQVTADDVTLRDFTLYGPTANIDSAYGIKVAPSGNDASARLRNFSIRDVTIRGSGKAELDLNGVDGATINRVTADGAPVGNDAGTTAGAGIQLTDSANVTISNSTTRNNAWGGLALYQANRSYDQQVNNIAVAGNNTFTERNPVYMQDESASRDFGALNIAGFDYAVRNSSSTNSNHQYTWLQASRQNAFDLAVNIGAPASSYVQGWNGALTTQNFHVGTGSLLGGGTQAMSIGTAVNVVNPGGTINVGAGTFVENVNITKALTLEGAGAGQSVIAPTAGDGVTVSGNIGASSEVLIGGFTFRNAPGSGLRVANDTVLNRLTIRNSDFLHNGKFGFFADGLATAGIPGLQNVSLLNSTFTGNGAPYTSATSLGQGDINFNYYNGNATLKDLRITGETEFVGIQFRGYHDNVASGGVHDAGRLEFDNVTIEGSFRRPSGSAGTWNPQGPGDAIHLLEYGSVANVSFNNVVINPSVGHGMFLEGLGSALDIGNTRFGAPDNATSGTSSSLTQSWNIYAGSNDRNNVKTNVNATRARFTGAASGFAIEDRVLHALDVTGLGVVRWEAGNVYVTQASGSIQRGVDAAGIGDTVNVANASFAENVTVNARRDLAFNDTRLQSLTLGSGAAGSGIGGAVTAEGAGGFDFHKDAPIRLLSDTTLTTTGADIRINGDIQNNGDVARGLRLIAGSGGARGNVHLATGGTASNRLGQFDVTANAFDLSSTLWVKAYTIDALGDVALSGHTLNTDTASSLRAGGNVTGATHGLSKVEVTSGKSMNVEISGVDVVARAQETMQAIVKASNSAIMAAETIKADVTAPVVTAAAVQEVQISGSSQNLTIDAPKGSVSGNFGQVNNTGSGLVNVNGKPQGNQTLSSNSENNRVVPAGEVGSGDESGVRVARVGSPVAQREGDVSLSMPEAAGDAIDSGQAVELDLSPRKAKDTKEEKSSEKEEQ